MSMNTDVMDNWYLVTFYIMKVLTVLNVVILQFFQIFSVIEHIYHNYMKCGAKQNVLYISRGWNTFILVRSQFYFVLLQDGTKWKREPRSLLSQEFGKNPLTTQANANSAWWILPLGRMHLLSRILTFIHRSASCHTALRFPYSLRRRESSHLQKRAVRPIEQGRHKWSRLQFTSWGELGKTFGDITNSTRQVATLATNVDYTI